MRCSRIHATPARAIAAIVLAVLVAIVPLSGRSAAARTDRRGAANLLSVPAAAAAPVSAALGRDDPAYRLHGLAATNPAQRLSARFVPAGAVITAGSARFSIGLRAFGRGPALRRLPALAPIADGTEVSYRRGALREIWRNGPLGLEQSFVLARAPDGAGPLGFSVAIPAGARLSGDTVLLPGGLRYAGLRATDARARSLRAWLVAAAPGRIVIRVSDRRATYPITVDPFIQQAALTASDGVAGSALGWSVAISGNTIVAGAEQLKGTNPGPGAVYVFTEPSGGWANATQTAKLTASDGAPGDALGSSVAISGDTIVAGAPDKTVGGNADQGALYVFVKPSGGWAGATQTAELTAADGAAADLFGRSVAIAGNTIVAGSDPHPVAGVQAAGAVYVFQQPAGGWASGTQTAELTASGGAPNVHLGSQVAISADGATIAAGAFGYSTNPALTAFQGAVFVYEKPASGWANGTQSALLTASDAGASATLGNTVAISADGDTIVGGAPGYQVQGASVSGEGALYVFVKPGGGWADTTQETAQLTATDTVSGSFLGDAVAITGATIYGLAPGSSSLYEFAEPPSGWATTSEPATAPTPAQAADRTAYPIAAAGGTLLVGGPANTVNNAAFQGEVFVLGVPGSFATPSISGIAPSSGAVGGGTAVTITGTNFTGASAVTFGGVPATSFSVVSGTEIVATSPPGSAGTADVVVTTAEGSSPTVAADAFTYGTGSGGTGGRGTGGGGTGGGGTGTGGGGASGGGGGVGAGGGGGTPSPAGPPAATSPPSLSGSAKAGGVLTCSTGTWTNDPTGFSYQWYLGGTPIQGATSSTFTVQPVDQQLALTCSVTASNASGSGVSTITASIPVRTVKNCPAATGTLSGTRLGLVRLGETRAQVRHAYTKSSDRHKRYEDFFCLTPIGVRVGYASSKLLDTLPRHERAALTDRVIWASTSSAYYTLDGIRVGATVAAAAKVLKLTGPLTVGANDWYLAPNGGSTAVLKVRHGIINEIGVGDRALTATHKAQLTFLKSFS